MLAVTTDSHLCVLDGAAYRFRTPTVYDTAKIRRRAGLQRVRRAERGEFLACARRGIVELARIAQAEAEGEDHVAAIEEWYRLLEPLSENDIDEPDMEKRGAELGRREAERRDRQLELLPLVRAIEGNLERHWADYAALVADNAYYDTVVRIDAVRLLLVGIGATPQSIGEALRETDPLTGDSLLADAVYQAIPREHRGSLATFAFGLLAPDEGTRKN